MHKFLFAAALAAAACAWSGNALADWRIEFEVAEPVHDGTRTNPFHWEVRGRAQCWYFNQTDRKSKTYSKRYDTGQPLRTFADTNNTTQPIILDTDSDNEVHGPCFAQDKWIELRLRAWDRRYSGKGNRNTEDSLTFDRTYAWKITGGGLLSRYHYIFDGKEVAASQFESTDLCTRIIFYGSGKPEKLEKC